VFLLIRLPVLEQMITLGTDSDVVFDAPRLFRIEFAPNELIGELDHVRMAQFAG